jgi:hypothetical protein
MAEKEKDVLSNKQRKAISLLVTGMSAIQAAKAVGVHENSIYLWNKLTCFQDALKDAERESMQALTRQLLRLAERATDTLENVMDRVGGSDASRVRAADVVLGRLMQTRELLEIEERLARLEGMMNNEQK